MLSFTVPGEARGKGRPRATVRGGHARLYTDAKTRKHEASWASAAAAAMGGREPLEGPLAVEIAARMVPPASTSRKAREAMLSGAMLPAKKPDLDNIIKSLDGLNGIAFRDDAQIVQITAWKLYAETAGVDVLVKPA
jgi:Holliday junction resolvase RusA-like endonuclease